MASLLVALLAACGTTQHREPGNVSHLPPGNSQRDGPEASPPANLDAVPDAVPQIEPLRIGGPNKPYEIDGHTYVPLTDDRAVAEKGLASWYGKKFHGRRTASGEAYNMYAMTAAHKTLPIPSYARVRNPANGREIVVRVNDRGPFSPGRVIDLSYTAALKLGVLGGVTAVEIERITEDDIRTGAAFRHGPNYASATAASGRPTTVAIGDVDRGSISPLSNAGNPGASTVRTPSARARNRALAQAGDRSSAAATPQLLPPTSSDVLGRGAGTLAGVDLGAAAASDVASVAESPSAPVATASAPAGVVLPPPAAPPAGASSEALPASGVTGAAPASSGSTAPPRAQARDEHGRAETPAGTGFWIQLGAYKERSGALEFQHRLVDEQPWLAPLLAVFSDRGLNKLQAGPYSSREDAKSAAEHIRVALQLVPTIVEKR